MEEIKGEEEDQERALETIEKQMASKRKEQAKERKKLAKLTEDIKKKEKELQVLRPTQISRTKQREHAKTKVRGSYIHAHISHE